MCNNAEYIAKMLQEEAQLPSLWSGLRVTTEALFGTRPLFLLEGKAWTLRQQAMCPHFLNDDTGGNLLQSIDLAPCTATLVEKLNALHGQEINMALLMECWYLSAFSRILFTTEIPALSAFPQLHPIHQALRVLFTEFSRRAFHRDSTIQQDFRSPSEDNRTWAQAKEQVRAALVHEIRSHLGTSQQHQDLLTQLLKEYQKANPKALESNILEDMSSMLLELLFEGYHSVAFTLTLGLYNLVQHPASLQQVRAEATTNAAMMPFLMRCFQETLRLYPAVPMIGRKLHQTHHCGTMILPAHQIITIPILTLHRDGRYWKHPDTFNPDRFLEPVVEGSFLPFGNGHRRCIGETVARSLFCVGVGTIVQRFNLVLGAQMKMETRFNGFGTVVWDETQNTSTMRMILTPRQR